MWPTNIIVLCMFICNITALYNTKSKSVSVQRSSRLFQTVLLTPDSGVKKEVITPGNGKKVETGDILAIEFYASLPNQGNKPFAKGDREQFTVKDGSLIPGWDIAIESMKVGEKSKIICESKYAYGAKGVSDIIPPNSDLEFEIKILAWLGNSLRPESLFSKDLDIDPFIASTPEAIQAEYDSMQAEKNDKYEGSTIDIYLRRLRNISFGFGGSGFFVSQSGERPPWYLNPNLTFPAMIAFCLVAFITVFSSGAVKEKGVRKIDIEISQIQHVVQEDQLFS